MFRQTLFWIHLVLGLVAGIPIGIMCVTGAALSFEKEIIAWAERDARRIERPTPTAPRLPLTDLLTRVAPLYPEARIASVGISRDPKAAIAIALPPGNRFLYANPYTGELREGNAPRTRAFLRAMMAWHLRLNFAQTPGKPSMGAKLNSAANVVFLLLGITGLILWWPRAWTRQALRPLLWFVRGARGRARDWNWHNTIGFWSLPVIVVLAGSGVVLSYRWAGDWVLRLAGDPPSTPAARPARVAAAAMSATPSGKPAVSPDIILERVQQDIPRWDLITLRFAPPLRPGSPVATPPNGTFGATVRAANPWPPFAVANVTLDATTGNVQRIETFADQSAGQRARRWIRLLHTGEALRWPGQLVAGLACLGGVVLVWTGLAMAWRRLTRRRFNAPETSA